MGTPPPVPGYEWAIDNTTTTHAPGTGGLAVWQLNPAASPPSVPGTPGTITASGSGVPSLPDYSHIEALIQQINATNQQAQHAANAGRIPGAPQLETQRSQNIADLLNPPEQYAEIDVPSAARAVASGTVGSPFAGVTGLELTRRQRQADMTLGSNMLNQAYAANPAAGIADPMSLVHLLQQEGFQSGESERDRRFRAEQAALDRALQAQLGILRTPGYRGGGGYGPSLPTDYGRGGSASAPATFRAGIPSAPSAGTGPGSGFLIPTGAIPDNWADLNAAQQSEYAGLIGANPYYNMPDVLNPYANEYNPLDPSLAAYYE